MAVEDVCHNNISFSGATLPECIKEKELVVFFSPMLVSYWMDEGEIKVGESANFCP